MNATKRSSNNSDDDARTAISNLHDAEHQQRTEELEDHLTRQLSNPPFLVKTKTSEEKESMRQQFKKQEEHRKKNPAMRGPYAIVNKLYTRFSTSVMLENKSSVARDHLANERTFLAWLRTSLSLITVGVAITQLYHLTPQTGGDSNQVTQAKTGKALGAVFVIFSIVFLYFANARYFHTQLAMTKGQFPASRGAVIFGSTCILAVLVAMFVVIVSDLK